MSINVNFQTLCLATVLSLSLTACFDDNKDRPGSTGSTGGGSTVAPPTTPPAINRAPTISGTPVTAAKTNEPYAFQPGAADPDGDRLVFVIENKPVWATFDTQTGKLAGTPSSSSTGKFTNIRILASDGEAQSALAPFDITVASTATVGTATLNWQPPTENVDGTPLTDLAGYVIRYGTKADALDQILRVANPGITSAVVEGLEPATWYFTLSAYNSAGVESAPSAVGSKTVT